MKSLDLSPREPNGADMTNLRFLAAAPVAALFMLGACQSEPEVVGKANDPQAEALKNAAPVQLPPRMVSRTYRCADNSLVYADFASDGSFAMVGTSETSRVRASSAEANSNYSGEGYTIAGNSDDTRIKVPGKSEQSCRAHNR